MVSLRLPGVLKRSLKEFFVKEISSGQVLPMIVSMCRPRPTRTVMLPWEHMSMTYIVVTIGKLEGGVKSVQKALEKEFKITKKVNPDVVLGVQIQRNRETKWLKIHQADYIKTLLTDYNMLDCKPASTPMDPGTARALMLLPCDGPVDEEVVLKYQGLVGKYLWIMKTRAVDMRYTVNLLSRFVRCATPAH